MRAGLRREIGRRRPPERPRCLLGGLRGRPLGGHGSCGRWPFLVGDRPGGSSQCPVEDGTKAPPRPQRADLTHRKSTPGFLIYDFLAGRKSSILGCLGGPGRPGNVPNRWGAKPPTFLEGFPAARGRPDPPKSTISGRSKNHILKTQV